MTADYTSAMQWPVGGGGQQQVVQQLYGTASSSLTDNACDAWTHSNITDALAIINMGYYHLEDGNFWNSNQTVNTTAANNLATNFYKVDPLGIAQVVIGMDFDLGASSDRNNPGNNVTKAQYKTAATNLANYLDNFTMGNGKRFPLVGFCGLNEPEANQTTESGIAAFYNQMGPAVKAVDPNLRIFGPQISFMADPDFGTFVPTLDVLNWDVFTNRTSGSNTDPFNTSFYDSGSSGRFHDDAQTASNNANPKPKAFAWGGMGSDDGAGNSVPSSNSWVGAIMHAMNLITTLNNTSVPMFGGAWGGWGNGEFGMVTDANWSAGEFYGASPGNVLVTPKGYVYAQGVRKGYGPRWNVTGNSGLLTMAVTPTTGRLTIMVVNPGFGAKSGRVAFSHAPVGGLSTLNSAGTGTVSMWQMTTSVTLPGTDGTTSTVPVTAGVTNSAISFPDPSVTFLST